MPSRPRIRNFCMAMVLVFATASTTAQSSGSDDNVVNYSYAVVFGTGAYQVKDQQAFVFRLPLSRELREPSREHAGARLLLPVLAGFYDYNYDRIVQGDSPGDAATLSFVPGLEFEYVMNDRWRLKPYGQAGLGRDLRNENSAVIYAGGINSHYRITGTGNWQFALGNTLAYTGYDPDDGNGQSIGILGAGIDIISPAWLELFGKNAGIASYLIYYLYLNDPAFDQGSNRTQDVHGEIELGLALAFRKPRTLLGVEFDRIGLGLRYGDHIKGIRLVTEFPF